MTSIIRRVTVALGLSLSSILSAAAAESVYTKIDFDRCINLSSYEAGGSLHCAGHNGYGVLFKQGDLRQAVQFGHVERDDIFESFQPFNRANETIEWRLGSNGAPYATILRWFIENTDNNGAFSPATTGEVLVVSRVGQPGKAQSCVVGYVDAKANPGANDLARRIADTMTADFTCGTDSPVYHGTRGPLAGEPLRSIP